jgi:plastocyanin
MMPNQMMKAPWISAAAICLLLPGAPLGAQTVEGRVALPKPQPAEVVNRRYATGGEPALIQPDPPTAVVFLEGDFPLPKNPSPAQMPQKNLAFVTPLLAVAVGTTVEFPNFDQTYHNIFSYSKPKRFDLGRYRGEEQPVPALVFDKPGAVLLHCDIHEFMHGIILVLQTPHFQSTDPDGRYRLSNLPVGHFKLKAWLNNKKTLEKEVELKPGATLHVDFP